MIRVLVVEDEPLTGAAHAEYVGRCDGFEVVGIARTGRAAVLAVRERAASGEPVDLVLLDVNLPDMSGLEAARALRAQRCGVDLLVVTAHRDVATVREATSVGAVGFLVKPFSFQDLRSRLEAYSAYHRALASTSPEDATVDQPQLDRLFATLSAGRRASPPKGLAADTLEKVAEALRQTPSSVPRERSPETSGSRGSPLGGISSTCARPGCSNGGRAAAHRAGPSSSTGGVAESRAARVVHGEAPPR